MAKAKISKRTVDAAMSADKKYILWDTGLVGFGLKVTPAGKKVYIYQYRLALAGKADRTPPSLYTIGQHSASLTAEMARHEAERLEALVRFGTDPQQERRTRVTAKIQKDAADLERSRLDTELRFDVVAERWLSSLVSDEKSQGYYKTSCWAVRTYLIPVLGQKPLPHIMPQDIQAALDAVPIEKKSTPLAVHDTAFAIFKWASGTKGGRLVPENIVLRVDRPIKPKAKERYLADIEIALVWDAAEKLSPIWNSFYRLLILTGKRRSEVGRMDWSEINKTSREWLIPGTRTKNRSPDLVPLTEAVMAELEILSNVVTDRSGKTSEWPKNGFVLTSNGAASIGNYSKMKKRLDAEVAILNNGNSIPPWTVHDLRRTVATGMQRLGVRFEVTEAILKHTGKSKSGVAGIYQKHDWKTEKREALEKWAEFVKQMLAIAKGTNVVSIGRPNSV